MSNCPSDDELSEFLNESLSPERIGGVSAHVDGCSSCQSRLDKLTNGTDGAVGRYKDLSLVKTQGTAGLSAAGTLVIGGNAFPASRFVALPTVPGFDVLEEIGRGGMGIVYKARHRRLNRLVALKMILAGAAADARTVQRFLLEAEIMARVQHPQVVQVFEVDTFQGPTGIPVPYLAMELLEGGSLSGLLRNKNIASKEGMPEQSKAKVRLESRAAAGLIEGIARAVHSAHVQGVIHRDLKPGNILFATEEFGPKKKVRKLTDTEKLDPACLKASKQLSALLPKVTDFGLVKFKDASAELSGSGQVVGTSYYMAPEQAQGSREVGPQADVYALGAILFECLTGRAPCQGSEPMNVLPEVVNGTPPDLGSLCPGLPRDLAAVVMRCLSKDPQGRYESAADLADDLVRFQQLRPTIARPVTNWERLWLWGKRNPTVAGLAISLGIVLVIAFVAITAFWLKAGKTASDERHAKLLANLAESRS